MLRVSGRMMVTATTTVLLLAVTALASGCGADSDDAAKSGSASSDASKTTSLEDLPPATYEVKIVDGQPDGGPTVIKAEQGQHVLLKVSSDADHEVHLHGYDIARDVTAGEGAELDFVAKDSGSFEFEIEDTGALLATLEIR